MKRLRQLIRSSRENGGSREQVLLREDDRVAQLLGHPIAVLALDEESRQALGRDVGGDPLGVDAGARRLECLGIDVRGEHLQGDGSCPPLDLLEQRHRDRVRFLAGRAGGHPDAERTLRRPSRRPARRITCSCRLCHAAGSRKKLVTLISRSLNSAVDLRRVAAQQLDVRRAFDRDAAGSCGVGCDAAGCPSCSR